MRCPGLLGRHPLLPSGPDVLPPGGKRSKNLSRVQALQKSEVGRDACKNVGTNPQGPKSCPVATPLQTWENPEGGDGSDHRQLMTSSHTIHCLTLSLSLDNYLVVHGGRDAGPKNPRKIKPQKPPGRKNLSGTRQKPSNLMHPLADPALQIAMPSPEPGALPGRSPRPKNPFRCIRAWENPDNYCLGGGHEHYRWYAGFREDGAAQNDGAVRTRAVGREGERPMVDKSAEIQELAEAYRANRVAKTSIRAEVKEKYRAVIAEEIRERQLENDVRFANRLARVKEAAGLTLRDIQDGVLRTRTWSTWEYWRDLAGLAPERVSASLAKDAEREARKPYRVENGRVIVTRNESGPVDEFPVASVNRGADGETYVFWGPLFPREEGYEEFLAAFGKDVNRLSRFLNAAFGEYNETPEEYEEEED